MAVTQNTYTGNGSTVLYSFSFPYLESTDIKVSLNGTITTAYTLANATTIQFNTAPANGVAIRIYRETENENTKAMFYPGAAIRAQDLNDNFDQVLFVTQESTNTATAATSTANTALTNSTTAVTTSNTALTTANTASTNASAAVTTANTASTNASAAVTTANTAATNASAAVTTANNASTTATAASTAAASATTTANNAATTANSAASDASTALTKSNQALTASATATTTANSAASTATTAASNAASAVTTANTASSTANAAATTATNASTAAANAVTTANTASSNASQALTAANNAVTTANSANSTANTAASNATTAVNTANSALSTANSATATANTANSNAAAALNAVAGSLQYMLVANVAAIPASPANNLAIEVANSTGIENFSPLTNRPAWFVGDTGLSVRMQYSSAGATWNWLNYFANDVESRYLKLAGGTLTGQLKADDSTSVATPVISFDGDTNTGIARTGADELALVTGGTARMTIDSAGSVSVPGSLTTTGTVTGASLNPTSSTVPTNGIYLPAANSVGISTNGTAKLTVGAVQSVLTHNLRLDTTNANAALLVRSNVANGGAGFSEVYLGNTSTDTRGYISYGHAADSLAFGTSGAERLRITSAGRVGIGTSSPTNYGAGVTTISVNGSGGSIADFYFNGARQGLIGTIGSNQMVIDTASTSIPLTLKTNNNTALTIDTSQRVGIGTTSPADTFDCRGDARVQAGNVRFMIRPSSGTSGWLQFSEDGVADRWSVGIANGDSSLIFKTGGSFSGTERCRLDGSGRLLVGTSSASGNALLQVAGGIRQGALSGKPDAAGVPAIGETRIYNFNLAAANTWEDVLTPAADGNSFYVIHFRIGVSDRTNSFGFAQLYYSTSAQLILISGSASNIRVNANILQLNGTGFGSYGLTTAMHVTRIY